MIDKFEITGCRSSLFDVAELSNDYVAGGYNFNGRIAIGASWTRLELKDIYHEDTVNLGIAAAIPRFEDFSVGAAFKLFTLGAPGYEKYNDPAYEGNVNKASLDLGLYYHSPSKVWAAGFVVYNVNVPGLQLLTTTSTPDPVYRGLRSRRELHIQRAPSRFIRGQDPLRRSQQCHRAARQRDVVLRRCRPSRRIRERKPFRRVRAQGQEMGDRPDA